MPKIQWTDLPPALREHLFDRMRERKIRVEDLYKQTLAGVGARSTWGFVAQRLRIFQDLRGRRIPENVPLARTAAQRQETVTRFPGR